MDNEQTGQPQELYKPARLMELGPKGVAMYAKALRPSTAEVSAMLTGIRHKHKWSRNFIAALTRIPEHDLGCYERQTKKPTVIITRLIWVLYCLSINPGILLSPKEWATWGKTVLLPDKPVFKLEGPARKEAIAWLGERRHIGRLTLRKISEHFKISACAARHLCEEANYCPAYDLYRFKRKPVIPLRYQKSNKWMNVDWRKGNETISRQLGMMRQSVYNQRVRFNKLSSSVLEYYIEKAGVNHDHFAPFFKPDVRHYRAFHNTATAVAARKRSEASADNTACPSGVL